MLYKGMRTLTISPVKLVGLMCQTKLGGGLNLSSAMLSFTSAFANLAHSQFSFRGAKKPFRGFRGRFSNPVFKIGLCPFREHPSGGAFEAPVMPCVFLSSNLQDNTFTSYFFQRGFERCSIGQKGKSDPPFCVPVKNRTCFASFIAMRCLY